MKRFLLVLIIVSLVLIFKGCNNIPVSHMEYFEKNTGDSDDSVSVSDEDVDTEGEKNAEAVYTAISDKNVELLKSIISPYTVEKHDIDEEFQNLLNSIDGKVIGYKEINELGCSGYSDEHGDVYNSYTYGIYNIRTDRGKEYSVTVSGIYNYFYQPEKVGVNSIFICNADEYTYEKKIAQMGKALRYESDAEKGNDGEAKIME